MRCQLGVDGTRPARADLASQSVYILRPGSFKKGGICGFGALSGGVTGSSAGASTGERLAMMLGMLVCGGAGDRALLRAVRKWVKLRRGDLGMRLCEPLLDAGGVVRAVVVTDRAGSEGRAGLASAVVGEVGAGSRDVGVVGDSLLFRRKREVR